VAGRGTQEQLTDPSSVRCRGRHEVARGDLGAVPVPVAARVGDDVRMAPTSTAAAVRQASSSRADPIQQADGVERRPHLDVVVEVHVHVETG